jgi:hypothetical protein
MFNGNLCANSILGGGPSNWMIAVSIHFKSINENVS